MRKREEKRGERIRGRKKVGSTLIHYERGLSPSLSRFTHNAKGKKVYSYPLSPFSFPPSLSLSHTQTHSLQCIKFHAHSQSMLPKQIKYSHHKQCSIYDKKKYTFLLPHKSTEDSFIV